jgi:flavin-dependent dehydrogenase
MHHFEVTIIGGGPAGLTAASVLAKNGINTCLLEKSTFPRKASFGGLLSGRALENIGEIGVDSDDLKKCTQEIQKFKFCSPSGIKVINGKTIRTYGLKRSALESLLLQNAVRHKCILMQPAEVTNLKSSGNFQEITFVKGGEEETILSNMVIAGWGNRSVLDISLDRVFTGAFSGFNISKYIINKVHLNSFDDNEARIYTGGDMFCGIVPVSGHEVSLAFLHKNNNGSSGSPGFDLMLERNRHFAGLFKSEPKEIFSSAISYKADNVYFGKRELYFDRILFAGDSGGFMAPFTGDEYNYLIESGKMAGYFLSEIFEKNYHIGTEVRRYKKNWRRKFGRQLKAASIMQKALLGKYGTPVASAAVRFNLLNKIIF